MIVVDQPWFFPFFLAWAIPALTRSRKISLSNSAKMASSPAIALPVAVVRSNAFVKEINPTPNPLSSLRVGLNYRNLGIFYLHGLKNKGWMML